ncbi:prepilin peptidase [Schleiferilactobacillus shenzhenensis]|uniref:Leader peptidase (Prepilin peptidase) / N-methyltransferase n=1 Tax=Schleiferilactobacillus shenzhenensis LY-73 TaxID=1231336 RepID=U4TP60_9LACO|nr:A24 family peptidase [Schleiferilactobacillus shenzhenensis]ERL66014.1 leader peptidase (prepilin peptidase) / N-methyltransferase [Schleiferilactobacillus shenzhenensis LY-73]
MMIYLVASLLGTCWASFVMCQAWRSTQPQPQPARSYCPACRTQLVWQDNIPVVSFLVRRGRCRTCRAAIDPLTWYAEVVGAIGGPVLVGQPPAVIAFAILLSGLAASDAYRYNFTDGWFWLGAAVCVALAWRELHWWPALAVLAAGALPVALHKLGDGDWEVITLAALLFGLTPILIWLLTGSGLGIILILMRKSDTNQQMPFLPVLLVAMFTLLAHRIHV